MWFRVFHTRLASTNLNSHCVTQPGASETNSRRAWLFLRGQVRPPGNSHVETLLSLRTRGAKCKNESTLRMVLAVTRRGGFIARKEIRIWIEWRTLLVDDRLAPEPRCWLLPGTLRC